jgi:hypothetical protein
LHACELYSAEIIEDIRAAYERGVICEDNARSSASKNVCTTGWRQPCAA